MSHTHVTLADKPSLQPRFPHCVHCAHPDHAHFLDHPVVWRRQYGRHGGVLLQFEHPRHPAQLHLRGHSAAAGEQNGKHGFGDGGGGKGAGAVHSAHPWHFLPARTRSVYNSSTHSLLQGTPSPCIFAQRRLHGPGSGSAVPTSATVVMRPGEAAVPAALSHPRRQTESCFHSAGPLATRPCGKLAPRMCARLAPHEGSRLLELF